MKNLKIEDIATLEILSFDDMEQVVGGMDCPERRGSAQNKKDITAQSDAPEAVIFGILLLTICPFTS